MSKRIGFVVGDTGPSGYFRLALPAEALARIGEDVFFALSYEDFESADILVFQRQSRHEAIEEILKWQRSGKKIVLDFDDNFFQLDPHNKANFVYTPEVIERLKNLVTAVDAVTVATEPLAQAYGAYARQIHCLRNFLPAKAFDAPRDEATPPIVGWHGSDSHFADLKMIKSALVSVVRKHGSRLVLAGYNPPGVFRGVEFRPWVRFTPELDYYRAFSDFAVGLCPLAITPFNEGKSDLKWLEYSSLGIPTVVSAVPAYADVEDGVTGLVARNLADWERQLSRLLSDEDLRRSIGEAAKARVKEERTIDKNIQLWRDVFAGL